MDNPQNATILHTCHGDSPDDPGWQLDSPREWVGVKTL